LSFEEEIKITFGRHLENLIDEGEDNMQKQAQQMDISPQTLYKYLSKTDGKPPTSICGIDKLVRIARYYNVSTDYLLGLTDIKTTDIDIKLACKTLGLTEEAAKAIISLRSNAESQINIMEIIAECANETKEESEKDNKIKENIEKYLKSEYQIFDDNILSKLLVSEYFNKIVFYCTIISKNARELIELYEQNRYLLGEMQKIAKLEKELKLSQYEAATIFQKIISIFDEHETLEALRKDYEEHIKNNLNNVINADNAYQTEQN